MCIFSMGWVQALAFSTLGIAVVCAVAFLVAHSMDLRHKRKVKRMEHDMELAQQYSEVETDG